MFPCLCSGVRAVGRAGPGPLVSATIIAGRDGVGQPITPAFNLGGRGADAAGCAWPSAQCQGHWPPDDSGCIPDPEELIRELMPIMHAGDVLAHSFTRHPGGFVSAKTASVSRGGHHAGNGSPGNLSGTGGEDGHGKRI